MRRRFPVIRRTTLLLGDIFLIFAGLFAAIGVNSSIKSIPQQQIMDYYTLMPVIAVSAWILLTTNGLLSIVRMLASQVIISVGVLVCQLLVVTMAASFLLSETHSRSVLLIAALFQFFFLSLWKYLLWRMEKARLRPQNVLVIGSEPDCARIMTRLSGRSFSHYAAEFCSLTQLDIAENWHQKVQHVELIIISSDVPLSAKALIVQYAHDNGKQVALIPDFYELLCINTEIDKYDDIPVFRAKYLKPTLETQIMKRGLDLFVAMVALVMLWPLFVLIALAIRLDGKGTVFYSQVRTGMNETSFVIYKFRTMRVDAEENSGPVLASENDPRITRVGRILRAARLDELPQLINVLKGDMSIVGPRPERPVFVEQLKKTIPNYNYRHSVKPGITGFAQIYGKYNTLAQDKLVYDLIYIQRCSLFTDLEIMLQTARILLIKDSTEGVTMQPARSCLLQEPGVPRASEGTGDHR